MIQITTYLLLEDVMGMPQQENLVIQNRNLTMQSQRISQSWLFFATHQRIGQPNFLN